MKPQTLFAMLCALSLLSASPEARMYQWAHPQSGTIQLSGTPPAWYRSVQAGPRIFVFDNGQLVDDTAVPVDEMQRALLREQAFGVHGVATAARPNKREQPAENSREAHESATLNGVDVNALASQATQATADPNRTEPSSVAATIAELKALLNTWDEVNAERARTLLDEAQTNEP